MSERAWKLKRAAQDKRLYEAIQGFSCQCDACRNGSTWESVDYCARCGHGYICIGGDQSKSSCTKCGAVGDWVEQKPDLPVPPPRGYSVRLQRSIEQLTTVVVEAISPYAAVMTALAVAKAQELTWTSQPPMMGPHSIGDVRETQLPGEQGGR